MKLLRFLWLGLLVARDALLIAWDAAQLYVVLRVLDRKK